MDSSPTIQLLSAVSNLHMYPGSSSFGDPDVVEIAQPVGWNSTHKRRKSTQVAPHEVIEIDENDGLDDDDVTFISESMPSKNKQPVVQSKSRQKQEKDNFSNSIAGSSSASHGVTKNSLKCPEAGSSFLKISKELADGKYDYGDYGFSDYDDDDGSYEEYDVNADLLEIDYDTWLQRPANDQLNKAKQKIVLEDPIDVKYRDFKKFDTVEDHSDNYFSKTEHNKANTTKNWAKRIQNDWKILENDLPETIFVRVYEDRMDILRAVIIGPAGTPYHDGLFFFDAFFPPTYPQVPPVVHYHSGGLRLNPNLYNCGKVCLSLLNTWTGTGCEKWSSTKSTMLQVLVSIQALVLNAKPYFNEPGFANSVNTDFGEKASLSYNENAFLLSCKTMLYSLRRPPKHFEDFVAGHFRKHGHAILAACKAYMGGALVGSVVGNEVQSGQNSVVGNKVQIGYNSSRGFNENLKKLFEDLLMEFTVKGVDCDDFLAEKSIGATKSKKSTNTRLSLGR